MEEIVNEEVKEYCIKLACELSKKNRNFRKIYGKDFVKTRLAENLNEIITDASTPNKALRGYYCQDKNIKIFLTGKNGGKLTVEDIKNNDDEALLLHELTHAIFRKSDNECDELYNEIEQYYNKSALVKVATGIFYAYGNKSVGRGLNEGLTNWICDILGKNNKKSYKNLTSIVHQIENAVGKKNIMKIAKGRNKKHL